MTCDDLRTAFDLRWVRVCIVLASALGVSCTPTPYVRPAPARTVVCPPGQRSVCLGICVNNVGGGPHTQCDVNECAVTGRLPRVCNNTLSCVPEIPGWPTGRCERSDGLDGSCDPILPIGTLPDPATGSPGNACSATQLCVSAGTPTAFGTGAVCVIADAAGQVGRCITPGVDGDPCTGSWTTTRGDEGPPPHPYISDNCRPCAPGLFCEADLPRGPAANLPGRPTLSGTCRRQCGPSGGAPNLGLCPANSLTETLLCSAQALSTPPAFGPVPAFYCTTCSGNGSSCSVPTREGSQSPRLAGTATVTVSFATFNRSGIGSPPPSMTFTTTVGDAVTTTTTTGAPVVSPSGGLCCSTAAACINGNCCLPPASPCLPGLSTPQCCVSQALTPGALPTLDTSVCSPGVGATGPHCCNVPGAMASASTCGGTVLPTVPAPNSICAVNSDCCPIHASVWVPSGPDADWYRIYFMVLIFPIPIPMAGWTEVRLDEPICCGDPVNHQLNVFSDHHDQAVALVCANRAGSMGPSPGVCAPMTVGMPGQPCIVGLHPFVPDFCATAGFYCRSGACCACGGPGQECCDGPNNPTPCAGTLRCNRVLPTDTGTCGAPPPPPPPSCGGVDQPCCFPDTCGAGLFCNSGTCRTWCTLDSQCGAGAACNSSLRACVPCGASSQICCSGSSCNWGLVCSGIGATSQTCVTCGIAGNPCSSNPASGVGTCDATSFCSGGLCSTACGGAGQPCCGSGTCSTGNTCSGGTCTPCGYAGGPCCAGVCGAGTACDSTDKCTACGHIGQQCCDGNTNPGDCNFQPSAHCCSGRETCDLQSLTCI